MKSFIQQVRTDAGLRTFLTIWLGQFASQIGTALTRFALLVWTYQQTGSATNVALLGFFAFLPPLIVSPFAGVWVDRMDRRKVMLLADSGAGLITICMFLLYLSGNLEIWHLYIGSLLASSFEQFQNPAYTAASTLLLPKEHYARASGMRSMAEDGAKVIAPVVAGLLLVLVGLGGVMIIDLITFAIAVWTLLIVRIPNVAPSANTSDAKTKPSFWAEMRFGFSYLWQRPGLLGLVLLFTVINFIAALTYFSTMPAMILARSGGSEFALAMVQGALGLGGVLGGIVVSTWGGPKRKIHAVLLGLGLSFLLGDVTMALGQSLPFWVVGGFIGWTVAPLVGGANQAIFQMKVDPAVQGRVFATKNMLGQMLMPIGFLVAGTLADEWLEPEMMQEGSLASAFGWLVGVGPGNGIALMFLVVSIAGAIVSFAGYLFPALRNVEDDLPDHDEQMETIGEGAIVLPQPA